MKKNSNSSKVVTFFQNHPLALHLLYMLGVSIVLIALILFGLKFYTHHGKEYQLPYMVGMSIPEAQEASECDLEFVIQDSTYQQGVEGGVILRQDPDSGSFVKNGRKVYVTLSCYAKADTKMPDLISMDLKPALSRLENAGLTVGKLSFVDDPNPVVGRDMEVLSLSINGRQVSAGDKVAGGSVVNITMGINPAGRSRLVQIPLVLGETSAKARKSLYTRGLNVIEYYDDGVTDRANARVYRQDPEYIGIASSQLGTTVSIWMRSMSEDEGLQIRRDFRIDSSLLNNSQSLMDSISGALRDVWESMDYDF